MLDRVAPKWITTVSVLLTTAGFIAASFVKSPLGLYLSYGVLVGIGSAGSGAVACTASIGKWFVKKRGIAILNAMACSRTVSRCRPINRIPIRPSAPSKNRL